MKVLILAGGQGTRLGQLGEQITKPMIRIDGRPVLEYQIELLKKFGFADITLIVGHLQDQIQDHFGNGAKWGVKINYWDKNQLVGTAGRIKDMENQLREDFFVIYGDLLFNVDLAKMLQAHQKNKITFKNELIGTLLVQPTNHPKDCDLLEVGKNEAITSIFSKPHPAGRRCRNLNNAAIYIFTPQIFTVIKSNQPSDFGRDVFPDIVDKKLGILCAYKSNEYLQDMGTPKRLKEVEADVLSGRYQLGLLPAKENDFIA